MPPNDHDAADAFAQGVLKLDGVVPLDNYLGCGSSGLATDLGNYDCNDHEEHMLCLFESILISWRTLLCVRASKYS